MTPHRHVDEHKGDLRAAFLAAVKFSHGEPQALLTAFRQLARPVLEKVVAASAKDEQDALRLVAKADDDPIALAIAMLLVDIEAILGPTVSGRDVVNRYIADQGLEGSAASGLLDASAGLNEQQATQLVTYREGQIEDQPPGIVAGRVNQMGLRLLNRRADAIAEDQGVRASSAGQDAAWQTAIDAGAVDPAADGVGWSAVHDNRTDEICRDLDGIVVPFGKPFPGGIMAPPAHPLCRCQRIVAQLGG